VKPLRSALVGVAALVAVSLLATACDTSPYAAKVNSQVIRQTELNAELREWAGNTTYVSAFNSANTSSGVTVAGDAPGTYSTTWVAGILDGMVAASVVRQRLAATEQRPSDATEAAARSVNEISQVGWANFSPAFRQVLTDRIAAEATLTPTAVPQATMLSAYNQYKPYFFLEICANQSSAFSSAQAAELAAQGVPNGVLTCYDQVQFEAQPAAFQTVVRGLPVGKVSPPIKTSYGYQVVKVVRRDDQSFSADLQRVLSLAIASGQGPDTVVNALLAKASVRVNPAYGTWTASQVQPPVAPSAGT
jgi:PPIC-type PPIASE domain